MIAPVPLCKVIVFPLALTDPKVIGPFPALVFIVTEEGLTTKVLPEDIEIPADPLVLIPVE